jgi:hypothetical protein
MITGKAALDVSSADSCAGVVSGTPVLATDRDLR